MRNSFHCVSWNLFFYKNKQREMPMSALIIFQKVCESLSNTLKFFSTFYINKKKKGKKKSREREKVDADRGVGKSFTRFIVTCDLRVVHLGPQESRLFWKHSFPPANPITQSPSPDNKDILPTLQREKRNVVENLLGIMLPKKC